MTSEDILNRIGSILDELKAEQQAIHHQPQINLIEIELFEANANFLKEHITILKKLTAKEHLPLSSSKAIVPNDSPKVFSVDVKEANHNLLKETVESKTIRKEPEAMSFIFDSPSTVEKDESTPNTVSALPHIASEKVNEKIAFVEEKQKTEEEAWAELNKRFQSTIPSINDKISSQNHNKTAINTIAQPLVGDLRKAVGLNDKFAFIKGLFGNSVESFERALTDLNACNTFAEAKQFVNQQLVPCFNWSQKPDLHEQFLNIVKRRFNE